MLGAIIGDIVGSPYEVMNVFKRSEIRPFKDRYIPEIGKCRFTDDTVLTIAVARALEENLEEKNIDIFEKKIAEKLKYYVEKYPLKRDFVNRSLYGSGFEKWAKEKELNKREAYINEKGNYVSNNGAAMRVASVGWMYSSIEEVLDKAKSTAVYTHDSGDSIVAAQAIALSVFVARTTKSKAEIITSLKTRLGYDIDTSIENLNENVKEIRNSNNVKKGLKVNCDAKTTTQQAIYAFFISNGFSDCIKTAISFGGDSDTIACMAGAIAEAYYGIPQWWIDKAFSLLKKEGCYEDDLLFINDFRKKYCLNKYSNEKIVFQSEESITRRDDERTIQVIVDIVKPELEDVLEMLHIKLEDNSENACSRLLKKCTINFLGIIFDKFMLIPFQFRFSKEKICNEINNEISKFSSVQLSNLVIRELREYGQEKPLIQISVNISGISYSELRSLILNENKLKKDDTIKVVVSIIDIIYETLSSNDLEEEVLIRIIEENNDILCKIINEKCQKKINVKKMLLSLT